MRINAVSSNNYCGNKIKKEYSQPSFKAKVHMDLRLKEDYNNNCVENLRKLVSVLEKGVHDISDIHLTRTRSIDRGQGYEDVIAECKNYKGNIIKKRIGIINKVPLKDNHYEFLFDSYEGFINAFNKYCDVSIGITVNDHLYYSEDENICIIRAHKMCF